MRIKGTDNNIRNNFYFTPNQNQHLKFNLFFQFPCMFVHLKDLFSCLKTATLYSKNLQLQETMKNCVVNHYFLGFVAKYIDAIQTSNKHFWAIIETSIHQASTTLKEQRKYLFLFRSCFAAKCLNMYCRKPSIASSNFYIIAKP